MKYNKYFDLQGLETMTNETGIFQFSKFSKPDLTLGYTLDDNARALIVASKAGAQDLTDIYLKFLDWMQIKKGKNKGSFHNLAGIGSGRREFSDGENEGCNQDYFGRAIWGLGDSYQYLSEDRKKQVSSMLNSSLTAKNIQDLKYTRSIAFSIIGISRFLSSFDLDLSDRKRREYKSYLEILLNRLNELYEGAKKLEIIDKEWQWPEDNLTYENARIPQALLVGGGFVKEDNYKTMGFTFLNFLDKIVWENDLLVPVGNKGWYKKGMEKARYNQQPVDVGNLVETYVDAYIVTGDNKFMTKAENTFEWFFGKNTAGRVLYDGKTARVYDGIDENHNRGSRVSENQGAESLLAFLLAAHKLAETENKK